MGTKSPRDCMLKMSAVTQATEAGGGNPRPWSGGVEARGRVCQSRWLCNGYL